LKSAGKKVLIGSLVATALIGTLFLVIKIIKGKK